MGYATASDVLLLGASESAALATPDWLRVIPAQLLNATVEGADRSNWDEQQCYAADLALARINDALRDADSEINSALSANYSVPLAGDAPEWVHELLRSVARALARWWLADDSERYDETGRPVSPIADRARWGRQQLASIAKGQLRLLPAPAVSAATSLGSSAIAAPERVWTEHTLGGF